MSAQEAHAHATPPDSCSCTTSPLTPPPTVDKINPRVLRAIEAIQTLKRGRRKRGRGGFIEGWSAYPLDLEEYQDLRRCIRRDDDQSLWGFFVHKLRYDYFSFARKFVLRMPTTTHESVIKGVRKKLEDQIDIISSQHGPFADFAKQVESEGSADITFGDDDFSSHSPDGQFRHFEAHYPGIVFEVAFSQKGKDLARLADDYILGSNGNIRKVIGINLAYKATEVATVSLWEPQFVSADDGALELLAVQTLANEPFRDKSGQPNEAANISFPLTHFATTSLSTELLDSPLITISAEFLCAQLEHARSRAATRREGVGQEQTTEPGIRKRRRSSTPEERLEERDEKRFRLEEEEAEDGVKDDHSYKTESQTDSQSRSSEVG